MKFPSRIVPSQRDSEFGPSFLGRLDVFISSIPSESASKLLHETMSTRVALLSRGKGSPTKTFSASRAVDPSVSALILKTLAPGTNSARREQILGDPTMVQQFVCYWEGSVGFFTRPLLVTDSDGDTFAVGNFTDTIGEPYPVAVPDDYAAIVNSRVN